MSSPAPTEEQLALAKASLDPVWWMENVLGWFPWDKQKEIARAVVTHKHVAVPTGNAVGKSALMARIAMHWPATRNYAVAITTAPTERQVKEILWAEINKAFATAKFRLAGAGVEPSATKFAFSDSRRILGITAPEYDPNKFQGIRDKHTLIIVDEACGITPQIYEAIDGILAGGDTRLVEIGNPTDPNTPFAANCANDDNYTIHVAAYDTPNFTAFGITEQDIINNTWEDKIAGRKLPAPWLVQPAWARMMFKKHGLGAPEYVSRVKGMFPEQGTDSVFPVAAVDRAMNREASYDEFKDEPIYLSCDPARYGQDKTVIALRQGCKSKILYRVEKTSVPAVQGLVVKALKDVKATGAQVESIIIDVNGLGGGVFDGLEAMGYQVEPFEASGKPFDEERYANARAEAYWLLREALERGELDLPNSTELKVQMRAIKWKVMTSSGRIVIESKDDMRRRGLPSPDDLDAIVMAYYTNGGRPVGDIGITFGP